MTVSRRDEYEALYQRDADPWGFRTSPYEAAKYDATIAALGGRSFASGLELGCSIGILTARLARCCRALLAMDIAEAALIHARAEVAGHGHVQLVRGDLPGDWPNGRFDLIVLSEFLYFLSPGEVAEVARRAAGAIVPGGVIQTVNHTGPMRGLDGCAAEEILAQALAGAGLSPPQRQAAPGWQMALWTAPAVSAAAAAAGDAAPPCG